MDFDINVPVKLDTAEAEAKLNELLKKDRKIKIGVELDKSAEMQAKDLAKSIEQGLKSTKIDTSSLAKQLTSGFNISDKNVINNIQRQINSLLDGIAKTWNGKSFDISKATGLTAGLDKMAQTISQNAKLVQSKTGIYDEFANYFKNKKIYVSDDLKSAMGKDLYKELSNANIGKIVRDATKGISIDSIWGEMTDLFPEHFSKNITNQVDQIVSAFDVLKAARADVAKSVNFADMTSDQQFKVTDQAYADIVSSTNTMIKNLQSNINSASDAIKTEFNIDVKVNTDNIISDIKNALNQVNTSEPIKINLDINQNEIETQIRNAIQGISASDTPIDIKLNVSKQSIEEDIRASLGDVDLPIQFKVDTADLESQIRQAISAIDDVELDVHINMDDMQTQVNNAVNAVPTQDINLDVNGWDILQQSLNGINAAGIKGQSVFQRLNGSMREAFSAYSLANILQDSLYKIADIGEKAVSTVKKLNDIKTDLQMATGESKSYVDDLMQSYNIMGQELGKVTDSVAESSAEWLRQGYSIEDTNTLIRDSMMLSELGKLSASDSTQYLTSSMKGYGVEVQNVIDIVSKLGAVDLSAAVDAGGLAEGMAKVAVTANTAGISMDKLLGYLAVIGETSGQSMNSVGTAMRTILMRMQNIKAGKLELVDEDGTVELLSDVETTLKNVGIDLRSTLTDFNNAGEVIDNLASKWDSLNSTQQAALTQAFGGQRQGEYFRILMENVSAK